MNIDDIDPVTRGSKFSVQLGNFHRKANRNIDQTRRGVALRLFKAIIVDTPVLTGRARANWRCTINIPNRSTIDAADKNGGTTIQAVVKSVQASKLNDILILTNSLPYIHRIEYDGWSHTKAPRGMVRINVSRFAKLLGEEVRLVRKGGGTNE